MSSNLSADEAGQRQIDPLDLLVKLWANIWWIIAGLALGGALAFLYLLTATPQYRASATAIPPLEIDVASINAPRLLLWDSLEMSGYSFGSSGASEQLSVDEVFNVFRRNLRSTELSEQFFERIYAPYLLETTGTVLELDAGLRDLSAVLRVQDGGAERMEVVVELPDPALAAKWAAAYLELAAERTVAELVADLTSDIELLSELIQRRIQAVLDSARSRREDRITRLEEALQIATALGEEGPRLSVGRVQPDSALAAFVEGDLIYMRGVAALTAELDALRTRKSDAAFVPQVAELRTALQTLEGFELDSADVSVHRVEGSVAVPGAPARPRRNLVLLLGLLAGGLLGGLIALTRVALAYRAHARL